MSALNWVYLRLACTCEETCLSVWPSNASLYANSTCRYLRLLASPFGQGFIIANKCSSTHTYNSETRRAVVLPIIVRLQNSSGSHSFDYCATETRRGVVSPVIVRLQNSLRSYLFDYCATETCRGVVLPTSVRLGNSSGSCFTDYSIRLGNLSGS